MSTAASQGPFASLSAFDEEDGDPLDIMVLTDDGSQAFAGCLITTRLLAGIKAEQGKPDEKSERNDRLIGVMHRSREYGTAHSLDDVPVEIVEDIEHFFRSYNLAKGHRVQTAGTLRPAGGPPTDRSGHAEAPGSKAWIGEPVGRSGWISSQGVQSPGKLAGQTHPANLPCRILRAG